MTRRHTSGIETTESRVAKAALPGIILTYMLIFVLPIELSFYLGPLFMTPTRLFLLITAVPLIVILLSREKLMIIDWLLIGYVIWVALAFLVKRGGSGVEAAGQSFLEVTVSYLVARLFFKEPEQVTRLLRMIGLMIFVMALFAIPEAVLQQRFMHDIPRMLTGIYYEIQDDTRLGLLRAASTFENPILFGLFSATFLSLIWYSTLSLGTRLFLAMGVLLGTAMALSSAPMLLLVMQVFLIMAERVTRKIRLRAPLIMGAILAAVFLIETLSNRGVARLIASNLTFNPHTGYYRLLQWEHTIDDIRANPIFGLNFENWTRPFWMTDSIDNHWLVLAMNSGLPAVFTIFTVLALLAFRMYRRRKTMRDPILKSLMLGWIIGMAALFMGGWTVALFGKMMPAFFFLIGIGAALAWMPDMAQPDDTAEPDPEPQGRAAPYSRFGLRPGPQTPGTGKREEQARRPGAAGGLTAHSRFAPR